MKKQNKKSKETILLLIIGLVLGILLTGMIGWVMMPDMMINVKKSKLGFEETISAINESALATGTWKIPTIHHLSESIVKAGHEDMARIAVIELCHPHYAYDVLKNEEDRKISAIMPCRVGVFEADNGDVYISEMNTRLVSKMFGKDVASTMNLVADEQEEIFKNIFE